MTILVLGAEGMLGHKMLQILSERLDDVGGTIRGRRSDSLYARIPLFVGDRIVEAVDVMDSLSLEHLLSRLRPQVIVNCVGIIKQREEAKAALPSIAINSLLPHQLAHWSAHWGGRVIHFSTDCVFSGMKGHYTEEDLSDAEDLYGKSKFLGEVTSANALTLRTSIIGRELANFTSLLEWFLAQEGKSIRGFENVIYSGVTTNYMAGVVARIIEKHKALSGLYQVTSEPISKYKLLSLLRDEYRINVEIVKETNTFSDRSMVGERFAKATGIHTPPWPELAHELAKDETPYAAWR